LCAHRLANLSTRPNNDESGKIRDTGPEKRVERRRNPLTAGIHNRFLSILSEIIDTNPEIKSRRDPDQ